MLLLKRCIEGLQTEVVDPGSTGDSTFSVTKSKVDGCLAISFKGSERNTSSYILEIFKIEDTPTIQDVYKKSTITYGMEILGQLHTLKVLVGVGDVIALLLEAHQKVVNLLHVLRGCQSALHGSRV